MSPSSFRVKSRSNQLRYAVDTLGKVDRIK